MRLQYARLKVEHGWVSYISSAPWSHMLIQLFLAKTES